MKDKYLQNTYLVNYDSPEIQILVEKYGWRKLDTFHQIQGIYDFVRNNILFGYNEKDELKANQVLKDGIGQCNTKATLLIALLRAVGIPARLHAFEVDKKLQKGATSSFITVFAPSRIVHTWAEVYYEGKWMALEGVIIDEAYVRAIKKKFHHIEGKYIGYGIGTLDLQHLDLEWKGKDTFVQKEAIISEYGIYVNPDEFYQEHRQHIGVLKNFLYKHFGRYKMTKNVANIREKYQ